MPVTYYALDNEFVPSSGGNVNVSPDYSYFDDPPDATSNLTILADKADDDPTLFALGDTYTLTWTDSSGGGSMIDAEVIRSDIIAPGEGAIVFEGINSATSEPYQVVWTPGFDLDGWLQDNGTSSSSPSAFWTSDQDPDTTVQYVCFAAGTRIATPAGPRPVEALGPGALVDTRDNGAQPVAWHGTRHLPGFGAAAPVVFAPGALGNDRPLAVSQNHRILLSAAIAELYFGSAEVLVPAKALVNHRTIRIAPRRRVSYHHLLLDGHQIVTAEGVPCESLFPGEIARDYAPEIAAAPPGAPPRTARPALRWPEARLMAFETGLVPTTRPRPAPAFLFAA